MASMQGSTPTLRVDLVSDIESDFPRVLTLDENENINLRYNKQNKTYHIHNDNSGLDFDITNELVEAGFIEAGQPPIYLHANLRSTIPLLAIMELRGLGTRAEVQHIRPLSLAEEEANLDKLDKLLQTKFNAAGQDLKLASTVMDSMRGQASERRVESLSGGSDKASDVKNAWTSLGLGHGISEQARGRVAQANTRQGRGGPTT